MGASELSLNLKFKRYRNGDIFFGQRRDGKKNGLGILLKPNQLVFIGRYINNKPIGPGVLIDKQEFRIYDEQRNMFIEQFH